MSPETTDLHPLLAARYSPTRFDDSRLVTAGEVDVMLEAARWAPSAGNSQPWGFVTARRGEARHDQISRRLAPSSARWAASAGLLVVTLSHQTVEDTDLEYSEFADYDLGQAVAHLTLQAHAMGLAARQFRAFDLESLTADLEPAPGWRIRTMIAIGAPASLAGQRARRSVEELRSAAVATRGSGNSSPGVGCVATTTRSGAGMDEARARELLAAERAEVEALLREVTGSSEDDRDADADLGDSSDDADALESEGVDNAIESSLRERLAAVERAEKRLAEGTFGLSVQSGKPIPDERLEVAPTAELTVEEASARR